MLDGIHGERFLTECLPGESWLRNGDGVVPNLLERLGHAIWGKEPHCCCDPSSPALRLAVKCSRCGETIRARVEKAYEFEAEYDATNGHRGDDQEEPKPSGYALHKELLGAQCQQLIRVTMHFDAHRCVTQRQIEGGEFLEIGDCE
jgi:hypothetical protein